MARLFLPLLIVLTAYQAAFAEYPAVSATVVRVVDGDTRQKP